MNKKKIDKTLVITTIMCLMPMILGIILSSKLPAEIAVHFDSLGNPDTYFPKALAMFGLPVIMAVLSIYVYIRYSRNPKSENTSSKYRKVIIWLVPILSIVLIPVSFFMSMGTEIPIAKIGSIIAGIVIVISGNYLPKCRQNYTIGFKLAWTLDNENNWNKTHRFAGFLWIIGGLAMIINSLFIIWYINIIIILLLVVLPILYSFAIYANKRQENQ